MLRQLSARAGNGQGRAVHVAIHGACLKHWALSAPPAEREIAHSNISLSKEDPMKPTRWIAAVAVGMWCLAGGSAMGAEDKPDKGASHAKADAKINLNDASKGELMKLEGVGAAAAQKIIAYREAHGPFKRVHDLEKVEGVGKAVLEKNAGRLTVK
jgi:competence ComEA-like helix-hairpin-helix protein